MLDHKKRNAELYERIQSGDLLSAERMMEENLPLVVSRVDAFLRAHDNLEHLRDDLVGEGNLQLVQFVHDLTKPHQQKKNIGGCLAKAIDRAIGKNSDNEIPVGPRHSQQKENRKQKKEGDNVELTGFTRCDVDLNSLSERDGRRRIELREEIEEDCCATAFERRVVRLRDEGHVDSEIAGLLGLSQQTIQRTRKRIEERYNEQCLATGA